MFYKYSFGYLKKSYAIEQRKADKIIQKIEKYQKQNIASSGIHKSQKQDLNLSKDYLHTIAVKIFIHTLIEEMKGAFNISNLPVLNAFQKLDPSGLPDRDSLLFESYGQEELKRLYTRFLWNWQANKIHSKDEW